MATDTLTEIPEAAGRALFLQHREALLTAELGGCRAEALFRGPRHAYGQTCGRSIGHDGVHWNALGAHRHPREGLAWDGPAPAMAAAPEPAVPEETRDDGGELACPYCGHKMRDLWDLCLHDDYQTTIVECGECERPYEVQLRVSWTYTGRVPTPPRPAAPLPRVFEAGAEVHVPGKHPRLLVGMVVGDRVTCLDPDRFGGWEGPATELRHGFAPGSSP